MWGGAAKGGEESNPQGRWFFKREKVQREGQRCWSFLGLSLTVTEPGKDFEAGYFICLVNLEFLCPSYRQIRNVLGFLC